MLRVENLTKRFDTKTAVDHLNFQIKPGIITGLLGPNGAGKTTTMRLITGFLEPTDGNITYKNESIFQNISEFQSKLGYLPESAPLYSDMLVSEYLNYMADIRGVDNHSKNQGISRVVDLCELQTHLHFPISLLSKGFRQRVALAGTLIHDPEVIILDEPTSGLDPNQISHIRTLIRNLGKDKTIILSTHILKEVEDICDHAVIINNGSIVADSKVSELYSGNRVLVTAKTDLAAMKSTFKDFEEPILSETEKEIDGFLPYLINPGEKSPEIVFQKLKSVKFEVREIKIYRQSLENVFEKLTRS